MAKPVLLLGAGASIDAGLPSAFDLTQKVYEELVVQGRGNAQLFGYVVAKLIVRKSRMGTSPFRPLNVEEVYDTLKRFLSRDTDAIGEFVYSWDPITLPSSEGFDPRIFAQNIGNAFSVRQGLDRSSIRGDVNLLRKAGEQIARAIDPLPRQRDIIDSMRPYLDTLIKCLSTENRINPYLDKLTSFVLEKVSALATLNYDTTIEESFERKKISYDYGLSRWNSRKYVRFTGQSPKLIKLHGSVDWFENGDDIVIKPEDGGRYYRRALIFGGQSDKLVPNGPYLQLRHEFQRLLRATNVLGIVGYSFQDTHLNALIRAWASSRVRAKMVIMDPGVPRLGADVLNKYYVADKSGKIERYTVEIDHISATAASGMDNFLISLQTPPNLDVEK